MNMTKNKSKNDTTKEKSVIKRICHGRLSTIVQTKTVDNNKQKKNDNIKIIWDFHFSSCCLALKIGTFVETILNKLYYLGRAHDSPHLTQSRYSLGARLGVYPVAWTHFINVFQSDNALIYILYHLY